jgi:hypothetical protein
LLFTGKISLSLGLNSSMEKDFRLCVGK